MVGNRKSIPESDTCFKLKFRFRLSIPMRFFFFICEELKIVNTLKSCFIHSSTFDVWYHNTVITLSSPSLQNKDPGGGAGSTSTEHAGYLGFIS